MDPKDEIKQRVDIAELVGEYVPLKPAGPSRFRGLCPFHTEKTPSFHVSADKQIWHCFGCNEGGDCFAFLMKIEGMDFPEALMHLGKKVGVEVARYDKAETNEKRRLADINELAAKYYRKVLQDAPLAQAARDYLAKRGISDALAETFGLGFAPDAWDSLTGFLASRGFQPLELEKAGLALRRRDGTGIYDRFRARVMIPLCDQHGSVVGFTGRVMPGAPDDVAKYMNSPETAIYHKGRMLYGLHLAKQAIKREGKVIIVEGNLDVIASHKAGVEHVVGSSGTALTDDQLALLKRFTSTIVFSFDADAAGFKAAQRGIALARQNGFDVRVAVLPADAGKDPDEAVQKNPDLWRAAAAKTAPIMQYVIDRAVVGKDLSNVDDKRAVAAMVMPELGQIKDVIEREHWLQTVSDLLRTDIDVLRRAVSSSTAATAAKGQVSSRTEREAGARPDRASTAGWPAAPGPVAASGAAPRRTREHQAARSILGIFLQDPASRPVIVASLEERYLPDEILRSLYRSAREAYDSTQSDLNPATLFFLLQARFTGHDSELSLLNEVALLGEELGAGQVKELLDSLQSSDRDRRRKAIEADMRQAEASGDRETVEKLIREFNALR